MAFYRPNPAARDELLNDRGYAFGDCATVWPERCVLCNAPAPESRVAEEINEDGVVFRSILRMNPIIALMVGNRNHMRVIVSLCPIHAQQRNDLHFKRQLWMFLGIGAFVLAIAFFLPMVLLSLFFLILWARMLLKTEQLIPCRKISYGLYWASPAPEFVASLPLRTAQSRQKGGTSPVDDDLDILESDTPELR